MMTAAATGMLILVRHGESAWNLSNRFTGWMDVPLTQKGVDEAKYAGRLLSEAGMRIDVCYTSRLSRSIQSANVICDVLQETSQSQTPIPVMRRYRLNERHYGGLTGINKRMATSTLPKQELLKWRTTLDGRPPPLDPTDPCAFTSFERLDLFSRPVEID